MDVRTILIETVVLAILFTIGVVAGSQNPVDTVYDMPEPIINRCLALRSSLRLSWRLRFVL